MQRTNFQPRTGETLERLRNHSDASARFDRCDEAGDAIVFLGDLRQAIQRRKQADNPGVMLRVVRKCEGDKTLLGDLFQPGLARAGPAGAPGARPRKPPAAAIPRKPVPPKPLEARAPSRPRVAFFHLFRATSPVWMNREAARVLRGWTPESISARAAEVRPPTRARSRRGFRFPAATAFTICTASSVRCKIRRASVRKTRPASVSRTAFAPRSKSAIPSSSTKSRICRLNGG